MEMQLEKVSPQHQPGVELGPECLCPPVCFQCPPPFCLPCGPGPGGVSDGGGDNMPGPRQCGPFIMLNTPSERRTVILPMYMDPKEEHGGKHGHHHHHDGHHKDKVCKRDKHRSDDGEHQGHHGKHDKHRRHQDGADCCEKPHHHHHGTEDDRECCEKSHHHHHHDDPDDEHCKENKPHRKHHDDDSWNEHPKGGAHKKHHDKHHEKSDGEKEHRDHGEHRRDKKKATAKSARTNSRELRGGKLLVGCDCEKRNGLQDDCQRSMCQGSPECKTIPPTCLPSAFSSGKHLAKRRELAEKKLKDKYKLNS